MKKKLMIGLLASLFVMPGLVKSQEVNFGVKGGLNLSNLYIDEEDIDDENSRLGFHVGFVSQFMLAETFGIQPEFLFSTKGAEAVYSGLINQTVNFNINYIDVPVLLVFRPIPVMEIQAGPYFGFLLNSNIEYSGTVAGTDELDRDHFNTLDYGLAGGVAFNFAGIQAGVRYNLGLQKLASSSAANVLLGDSKHSYGQLFIALRFKDRFTGYY
jgi:hypothetical protein